MPYFIGLMSGTSLDAVDAVIVDLDAATPDAGFAGILHSRHAIPAGLRDRALRITRGSGPPDPETLSELDQLFGQLFADTVNEAVAAAPFDAASIEAIGSPGQTVWHSPDSDPPFTLQLGAADLIAERTGITTVAGFRVSDMTAGGQGAPLVPAFHNAVFRDHSRHRVIVNIGGIANITILPADPDADISGYDTGPGNALMDDWTRQQLGQAMDTDGRFAASGTVSAPLLKTMLADAWFAKTPPKSTGREYFNPDWIARHLESVINAPLAADVQATLCELTALSIAQAIAQSAPKTEQLVVCGGGAANEYLMQRIAATNAQRSLTTTTELGLPAGLVEPVAFAWLARQTLRGKPGNVPAVTGARDAVVLGTIVRPGETNGAA